MRILGIDPGTGRLGWAVLEVKNSNPKTKNNKSNIKNRATRTGGRIKLVASGLVETPARTKLVDRLELIYDKLTQVINDYKPEEMAIEELFFVKNVKTGVAVSHARGVVMLCGKKNKLKIFEYKPNEVKLGISGYGHATKAQMTKMLKFHLPGCDVRQDDIADAVAVSIYHSQMRKTLKTRRRQGKVVKK